MGVRRRRIVLAAVLCVLALAGLLVALGAVGGAGDGGDPAPRAGAPAPAGGGSAFGGGERRTNRKPVGLLDAIAPLLSEPAPIVLRAGESPVRRPGLGRLEGLTLGDAAGRLFLVGFEGRRPGARFFARLRARGWGGVVLDGNNYVEPAQLRDLAGKVRAVARRERRGVIVGARQHGGVGTAFPNLPPRDPAQTTEPRAAREAARLAGRQLRALRIGLTLAPPANLGVAGGAHARRSFGDDATVVALAVRAAVEGYADAGVVAVPGHFPGEGAASQDPVLGPATVGLSLRELEAGDMRPFAAVARRARAIQLSPALFAAYDGVTPATLLPAVVKRLRALGFRGAVVSGDLAAAALATGADIGEAAVAALKAGCDVLYLPGDAAAQENAWRAVVRALRTGDLPRARVRSALRRSNALR